MATEMNHDRSDVIGSLVEELEDIGTDDERELRAENAYDVEAYVEIIDRALEPSWRTR